jgi:alkaline phosphatase D
MTMYSRRRFIQTGVGAIGAGMTMGNAAVAALPTSLEGLFQHGVASGDPLADRVILWTRISLASLPSLPVQVQWRVAMDPELTQIVAEGEAYTDADRDFTVKVDALLPQPATTYYYAFTHNGSQSIIGRTRTAPNDSVTSLRIAVCSCSSIYSGYMNAYGRIAERNDLDLVVHCGDYIYNWPDENERIRIPADYIDEKDPETLEELRRRYAYYRRDPQLCRAHQQHPFAIIWDNHDIESGPKAAAIQAFHEWIPIRAPEPNDQNVIYRHLPYGPLLDIVMLDTRHIGRDPVASSGNPLLNDIVDDENRTLLGNEQYAWLTNTLAASEARWRLLGNQVMMAPLLALGVVDNPDDDMPGYNDAGLILNPAQWDGYSAERRRLFQFLRENSIRNNIVVTGDMHMSFAADLIEDPIHSALYDRRTGGQSVGVEFLATSVTRGNIDEQIGAVPGTLASIAAAVATGVANPHIQYADYREHGYGIVHITESKAVFEFWYTPILYQTRLQWLGASLVCKYDSNHLEHPSKRPQPTQGVWQARPAPQALASEPNSYFLSWTELLLAFFRNIQRLAK